MRKLCIKTAWRCAGRGGESGTGFISYGGLKWNDMHGTTVVEASQSKSSKLKFVPFVAGADRHSDWLLDFADYRYLVFLRGSVCIKIVPACACFRLPSYHSFHIFNGGGTNRGCHG